MTEKAWNIQFYLLIIFMVLFSIAMGGNVLTGFIAGMAVTLGAMQGSMRQAIVKDE